MAHNNTLNAGLAPVNGTVSRLSHGQLLAIEVATRTTSVFSVLGSVFIITTFVCFSFFRKPINRLVFFATWGNLLANVATLMSRSAIPHGPELTGLCELQGILIQWFMMADSLWVLCMATNVFLVFFYGCDSRQLRHLEKWYFIFAYGIPAIPALTYIILDHTGRRIMGPATLWCWIRKEVDWMRITFFYAPVWIVVSATLTIYIVTGLKIYRKRSYLRSFSRQSRLPSTSRDSVPIEDNLTDTLTVGNKIVVTTQIKYAVEPNSPSRGVSPERDQHSVRSSAITHNRSSETVTEEPLHAAPVIRAHGECRGPMETQDTGNEHSSYRATAFATKSSRGSITFQPDVSLVSPPLRNKHAEGHDAAMAYLKVAFLMFVALFVVWVPSSLNRVYQLMHKDHPNFALNFISATVLPLQGAWNATIYIFTTRSECKRAYRLLLSKITNTPPPPRPGSTVYLADTATTSRASQESDVELALGSTYVRVDQRRDSEVSNADSMVKSKPSHNSLEL